ncbi:MAG: phosphate ABC transporter permease PstA [Proteobacteria bacterium]|nr:phosphate ABC transporter permease PstA [Pseudomonadota bacterium]
MTDTIKDPGFEASAALGDAQRRIRRRYAAERRFKFFGLAAILAAVGVLVVLLFTIVSSGYPAFFQTRIALDVDLRDPTLEQADPAKANYRKIFDDALAASLPGITDTKELRELRAMVTAAAPYLIRDRVVDDPSLIGREVRMELPASDRIDQLQKGEIDRNVAPDRRIVTDNQIAWYDRLDADGRISAPFNSGLFFNADSRFPELAGLWGAIVGSFYALMVCFFLSFPIGIAAAIYLEEFAPKNRWTDLIEVNINNLAAVPSIVFGLLGLAVYIQTFGLPRSAPLVGGMTLALMALPTIIIASRAALKSVPPSVREAALGVGASHQQAVLHHVLPLAMPGMLTGAIIGLAQALGETAPLLLIGMNAFITSAPEGITAPSTALPTQIYIWADSPERGFVSRTSAAIIVLLGFLVCMNAVAIYLRKRLEVRW